MRFMMIALLALAGYGHADIPQTDFDRCRAEAEDSQRLQCYDALGAATGSVSDVALVGPAEEQRRPYDWLDPDEQCDNSTVRCSFAWDEKYAHNPLFGRLTSNEPNYFVYVPGDDEDDRVQFNLSLKYPVYDGGAWDDNDEIGRILRRSRFYLIYNGTYDFYGGSRESSPVISRRQNPGLAYQYNRRERRGPNTFGLDALRVGWYHESNGQIIETRQRFEAAQATVADAQDYISRGWDYLGIALYASHGQFAHELQLRTYCDCQALGLVDYREDEIFWEDLAEQPNINDYDGLRYRGEWRWHKWLTRLELKSGHRDTAALGNVSGRLSFAHMGNFPFSLFYYTGYGRELTTYHERLDYLGIGIELR
jgi:outer membrane phospholipase A